MGKLVLNMSMSLDGFIAGPMDGAHPERELAALDILHDWMFSGKTGREAEAWETAYLRHAGAFIMGRRVFDFGVGPWGHSLPLQCGFLLNRKERKVRKGLIGFSSLSLRPLRLICTVLPDHTQEGDYQQMKLEKIGVTEAPGVTHFRFRLVR